MKKSEELQITLVQTDIVWEDKDANLRRCSELIAGIEGKKEVVVLPEMFSTGFSMQASKLAESMDGPTIQWMRDTAKKNKIILTGSIIIEENGQYYNRLIWMQPDGNFGKYDKRHLFGYAGEDAHYSAGDTRLIVQVNGWKICPLICYDLRFPVWSRNSLSFSDGNGNGAGSAAYDVLLYVANWPRRRSLAWKTLLQARAIENQSYCIGVNRVGTDGSGFEYEGSSSAFDPLGEVLWQHSETEAIQIITLSRKMLEETRSHLPFLKDADRFIIPE